MLWCDKRRLERQLKGGLARGSDEIGQMVDANDELLADAKWAKANAIRFWFACSLASLLARWSVKWVGIASRERVCDFVVVDHAALGFQVAVTGNNK